MSKPRTKLTSDELLYLERRFADNDDRPYRIEHATRQINRVVAKDHDPDAIHAALADAIFMSRMDAAPPTNRRDVARAEKSLARLIADLRALLPADQRAMDDDDIWRNASTILDWAAARQPQRGRGRPPSRARLTADNLLKDAGVSRDDRREVLAAFGFAADE